MFNNGDEWWLMVMWETQCHKPAIYYDKVYSIYCDDWGMVNDIVLPTWPLFLFSKVVDGFRVNKTGNEMEWWDIMDIH